MANIDLSEERKLIISKRDYVPLYNIMRPQTYHRLYRALKNCENTYAAKVAKIMNHEKEHFSDKLNHLIEMDKLRDDLIKNQLSLGIIFERFIYTNVDANENKAVKLNFLLLYELYISLANRIEIYEDIISKYSDIEYKEDENGYVFQTESFKRTLDKIFELIGLENLHKIELDYKKLNINEFIEICIEKKDE